MIPHVPDTPASLAALEMQGVTVTSLRDPANVVLEEENWAVALPLVYYLGGRPPEVEARLDALVELTGLEPWADRYPAEVARNWQQRIGLARALALRPEVLLLDSPLTGLDPRDTLWWLETLDALAAGHSILGGRPLTLVVTGDDLRPWLKRARQFAVLKDHQFIALGGRGELGRHPEPLLQDLLPAGDRTT